MKFIFSFLTFLFISVAHAEVRYDLEDPDLVATMGDLKLSPEVITIFWTAYNHPNRPITPPQAMQRLLDEALLAEHARNALPKDQLDEENPVGFLNRIQREDRAVALLRKTHEKALHNEIRKLPQGGLDGIMSFNSDLTEEKLKKLMMLKSKVRIEATPDQIEVMKGTPVATVKLGDEQQQLTLWDIYQRQNVQGRLAMHSANMKHLREETKQRAGSLYIMYWAEKNLPEHDLAAIRQILLNEQHKTRLLQTMGLHADVHDDNPALRKKAETVSQKDVLKYYEEHKDEFSVVDKVKARHIRVASQELADKIKHKLDDGMSFSKAVKKYSIAEDKNNKEPGSLGWLKRADKDRSWLHSVAFIQREGQVSAPFRSPQNQGDIVYEIILVDKRVEGYLSPDDPTVRYEASRDVALKQLKEEFFTLQDKLRDEADIHLNKSALRKVRKQ